MFDELHAQALRDLAAAEAEVFRLRAALGDAVNIADNAESHARNSGNHTLGDAYQARSRELRWLLGNDASSRAEVERG